MEGGFRRFCAFAVFDGIFCGREGFMGLREEAGGEGEALEVSTYADVPVDIVFED